MGREGCIRCGGALPPLNGCEENDFAILCDFCRNDQELDEGSDEIPGLDADWVESEVTESPPRKAAGK